MAGNDRPRAIADVSMGSILSTVTIAVPPERVFRAITAEDQIPLWWGADDMIVLDPPPSVMASPLPPGPIL